MKHAESEPPRHTPPPEPKYTYDDILDLLERNDENENIIEREAKRDELLELLDHVAEKI